MEIWSRISFVVSGEISQSQQQHHHHYNHIMLLGKYFNALFPAFVLCVCVNQAKCRLNYCLILFYRHITSPDHYPYPQYHLITGSFSSALDVVARSENFVTRKQIDTLTAQHTQCGRCACMRCYRLTCFRIEGSMAPSRPYHMGTI